ncbi:MAG: DUF3108 domain-containing protein [Bdellovibrionia bacterium]
MEIYRRLKITSALMIAALYLSSCGSTIKVSENKRQEIQKNVEFERAVEIVSEEPVTSAQQVLTPPHDTPIAGKDSAPATKKEEVPTAKKAPETKSPAKNNTTTLVRTKEVGKVDGKVPSSKKGAEKKSEVASKAEAAATKPMRRQPELEDDEGFDGRRPVVDPFRVGEVITHDVHYFKVSAGELKLKVEPFAQVNGRRSYTFATEIETSSMFSAVYSVEDRAVTHVDYYDMVPRTYSLSVKESSQVREVRNVFNFSTLKGTLWEKKITKQKGEENKKMEWDILPFSQNVFSAIFYMRNFAWRDGKEYSFVVSHDKENLVFKGKVIRREKLKTKVGQFNAIVVKPEFTLQGIFKPVGDIFIWLSDDDRKYVLRIESKIKIGTLVSEVIDIKPGYP